MKKVRCVMKKTAVNPPGPIVISGGQAVNRPTDERPSQPFVLPPPEARTGLVLIITGMVLMFIATTVNAWLVSEIEVRDVFEEQEALVGLRQIALCGGGSCSEPNNVQSTAALYGSCYSDVMSSSGGDEWYVDRKCARLKELKTAGDAGSFGLFIGGGLFVFGIIGVVRTNDETRRKNAYSMLIAASALNPVSLLMWYSFLPNMVRGSASLGPGLVLACLASLVGAYGSLVLRHHTKTADH